MKFTVGRKICALFFILLPFIGFSQSDILNTVASSIGRGNSKEISKYFDATVELTIVNNESVYSDAQAEMVLKDFFARSPIQSFELIHRGTSGEGSAYGIGNLKTANQIYRVYYFVKQRGNTQYIREMRFEKQ